MSWSAATLLAEKAQAEETSKAVTDEVNHLITRLADALKQSGETDTSIKTLKEASKTLNVEFNNPSEVLPEL